MKRDHGQAARRLVHMSTLLVIPADMLSHGLTVAGLGILLAFYVFVLIMRMNGRSVPGATRLVGWLSRKDEKSAILAPPTYMFFSLLVLVALFPSLAAYLAIVALAIGDTFASLAGGSLKWANVMGGKTLAGSVGFFVPVFAVFCLAMSPERAALLAGVGAIAELVSHRYDNLTVPLVTVIAATLIL